MQIIVRVALTLSIVSTVVPCYVINAPVDHIDPIDEQRFKNEQLAAAARFNNPASVHFWIAQGAQVDARDGLGLPMLYNAALGGNAYIVGYLLHAGADPDKTEITRGETTLHYAAAEGLVAVTAALLHGEADPRITNCFGDTPADVAYDETIKNWLLDRIAKLNSSAGLTE